MQMLLNQKAIRKRKEVRKKQKNSRKIYGKQRGHELKNRIGKFVLATPSTNDKVFGGQKQIKADSSVFLQKLKESELTGMSGNGYLVYKKIETFLKERGANSYLIVNAAECEPGLVHDEWILENYYREIVETMDFLVQCFSITKGTIAAKKEPKGRKTDKIVVVPPVYPIGEEHMLIRQVFDPDFPIDGIPAFHSFLVLNVQTVLQIYRILQDEYESGRYITIADIDSGNAKITYQKYGESISSIMQKQIGKSRLDDVYVGSGIFGAEPATNDSKMTAEISFIGYGRAADIKNEHHCKGCGKCNRSCPVGVNVREIVKRREENIHADISGLGAEKCISCNSCTFFCRAEKNISEYLKG